MYSDTQTVFTSTLKSLTVFDFAFNSGGGKQLLIVHLSNEEQDTT